MSDPTADAEESATTLPIVDASTVTHEPLPKAFWPALVVGWAAITVGLLGVFQKTHHFAGRVPWKEVARWTIGLAVIHDLIIAPAVCLIGLAISRTLPRRIRGSRPRRTRRQRARHDHRLAGLPGRRAAQRQPLDPARQLRPRTAHRPLRHLARHPGTRCSKPPRWTSTAAKVPPIATSHTTWVIAGPAGFGATTELPAETGAAPRRDGKRCSSASDVLDD